MAGDYNVRRPLFDRLTDYAPDHEEARPARALDRRGLRESVRAQLEEVLNTRCPLPQKRLEDRPRTILEYGIADLTTFAAGNYEDCRRLAELLRRTIEAYEPRLSDVRVTIEPPAADRLRLEGRIEAVLRVGTVHEPVSFPTIFHAERAVVE